MILSVFFGWPTAVEAQSANRLQLLWSQAPFTQPYLTTNELPFERGMTYNPVSHRILVASRANQIYVLNPEDGALLHQLNMTGVGGATNGQYPILMIEAAEDGAIYVGNLNTSSLTPRFRLYRWANDNSTTLATLAFGGDPSPGTGKRWGDSMELRGAGTNTQVLITPRDGSIASLLTTINGTTFTARTINLTDTPSGYAALGLAFGPGNTFLGTTHTNPVRQITFDLTTGIGVTTRVYSDQEIPVNICPIGLSRDFKYFGGIHVFSPNHLRVYDLGPTNGFPILIGSTNFPANNPNTHTGAGSVSFGTNTVYALDSNNGLMALRILPPTAPVIEEMGLSASQTVLMRGRGSPGYYTVETSTTLTNWFFAGNALIHTNGLFDHTNSYTTGSNRFYRLTSQ